MNIKTLNSLAIAVLTAILTACGGTENGDDKDKVKTEIPAEISDNLEVNDDKDKVKTEIPAEISDNLEVKEYFETLDLVIDEYVTMVEKITITGQNAEKKGEEPSFTDAMKMATDITSSTMKMAPLLERLEQLENEAEIMKEDMTPEEVEAFSKTYAKMMVRYYDMAKKLEENQ
jgi:hypothetical protein